MAGRRLWQDPHGPMAPGSLPRQRFLPQTLLPLPFPVLGEEMDVEALPEVSQGCAWAAAGCASGAVLAPWQGPLAAALLHAMIYNLSSNGHSAGRCPASPLPAGTRLTRPVRSRLRPRQPNPSRRLRRGFPTVKTQKLPRWRGAELRVALGWRRPHSALETDATLLGTLGEPDTEELGSVKTRFVHNSNRKQQQ